MKLELKNLSFSYRDNPVLEAINLSLESGELVCVLGSNGAGKTTLFRCILSVLDSWTGEILLDGRDIRRSGASARSRSIAYIPQAHLPVFDYSVLEVVLMGTSGGRSMFGSPRTEDEDHARARLAELGIESFADRSYARLSGGERQLVLIARALAQEAKILVMDEPTANLDYGNQVRVMEYISLLAEKGYAILLSTHNPEHAFLWSTRTAVLIDGRIASIGAPKQILTEDTLEKLYGIPVKLFQVNGDEYASYRACVPVAAGREAAGCGVAGQAAGK